MKKLIITIVMLGNFLAAQAQISTPNAFLDLKLGTTLSNFLANNPDAGKGTFWVLKTSIKSNGMDVYTINRTMSSGDQVEIDCCFYNGKLAIISVEYEGWQSGKDLLDALESKYGNYSTYRAIDWYDGLAQLEN